MCVCVCVCVCVCMCLCGCVRACLCVYTRTCTHTHTHRAAKWLIFLLQLMCLIGEAFVDSSDEVCGAVVNIRPNKTRYQYGQEI